MKTTFSLMILLFVAGNISAQRIILPQQAGYLQHDIYQQVSTITAYEESINNNFLFLVDDDIQRLIFNPARALSHNSSFVSNSFYSRSARSGTNSNIHLAGLVPAKSGKWFYSVEGFYDDASNTTDEKDTYYNINESGSGSYQIINNTDGIKSLIREHGNSTGQGEFRLLKIFGDREEKAIAMGVFGGYSRSHRNAKK